MSEEPPNLVTAAPAPNLIEALLDAWDRNNDILVNLVKVLPREAFGTRVRKGGMTAAQLLTHIHFVRLILVLENAPDFARPLPEGEWRDERNPGAIVGLLGESARAVRAAVKDKLESGQAMALHYDHPLLMLQHLIWHEGYHHGQIKLALRSTRFALGDEETGRVTWDVWMNKTAGGLG